MENKSEVARLLENIRLSYESAQSAMSGPAMVASHEFITKRMERIEESRAILASIVGSEQAMKLVTEILDEA